MSERILAGDTLTAEIGDANPSDGYAELHKYEAFYFPLPDEEATDKLP